MKLYYNPLSINSRLAHATAIHLGSKLEAHVVDMGKGEHKSPEYLALNPNGKVPTLVDGEFKLWEAYAIASYLCEIAPKTDFYPTTPRDRAEMTRWASWRIAHFGPAVNGIAWENVIKPMLYKQPTDQAKLDQHIEQLHVFAPVLNAHLETRKWMNNDVMTLADFTLGCPLTFATAAKVPLDRYPHIRGWLNRLDQVDAWKKTQPPM